MTDQLASVRPRSCRTTDVLRPSTELSLSLLLNRQRRPADPTPATPDNHYRPAITPQTSAESLGNQNHMLFRGRQKPKWRP